MCLNILQISQTCQFNWLQFCKAQEFKTAKIFTKFQNIFFWTTKIYQNENLYSWPALRLGFLLLKYPYIVPFTPQEKYKTSTKLFQWICFINIYSHVFLPSSHACTMIKSIWVNWQPIILLITIKSL